MPVSLLITGYHRHPKMLLANSISGGELAEVLWTRGLDYCNEQGTDGYVPEAMAAVLTPTKWRIRVKGLVDAGLWLPTDRGWQYHDWAEWNRPAAELQAATKAKSAKRAEAGRKGAAVRWGSRIQTVPGPPVDLAAATRASSNGHGTADGTGHGSGRGKQVAR